MYTDYELQMLLDATQRRPGYNNSDVVDIFEFVNKNIDLFQSGSFYDGEDDIKKLIIPCFMRLYAKFFITPPPILNENLVKSGKLELFKLSFDMDDFLNYLLKKIPVVKDSLREFDSLDRTNETLSLLVDNYIAGIFKIVYNCEDVVQMKRELKLKKTLE